MSCAEAPHGGKEGVTMGTGKICERKELDDSLREDGGCGGVPDEDSSTSSTMASSEHECGGVGVPEEFAARVATPWV